MFHAMLRRRVLGLPPGVKDSRRRRVRAGALGFLAVGVMIVATASPSWAAGSAPPTTGAASAPVACKAASRQLKNLQEQLKRSQTLLGQLGTNLTQLQRRGRPAQVALAQSRLDQLQQYHDNVAAAITELRQRCGHTAR